MQRYNGINGGMESKLCDFSKLHKKTLLEPLDYNADRNNMLQNSLINVY